MTTTEENNSIATSTICSILASMPLGTPSGVWGAITAPKILSGERPEVCEVGCAITRVDIVAALASAKVKLPASEVDALTLAAGYALSLFAARCVASAALVAAGIAAKVEGSEPTAESIASASRIILSAESAAVASCEEGIRLGAPLAGVVIGSRLMAGLASQADGLPLAGAAIAFAAALRCVEDANGNGGEA